MRNGQGVLFLKPEGYHNVEKQYYRGNFRSNLIDGHGHLYWPGSETLNYVGRFKAGLKHGRGILFNEQGIKVYHGAFREGKKDGRGELFGFLEGGDIISGVGSSNSSNNETNNQLPSSSSKLVRLYKGEFADDMKHGFGVAYYGASAKYIGRFECGQMSGVGVYCHPNGDRFEGMFFNNKSDGAGSFYEVSNSSSSSNSVVGSSIPSPPPTIVTTTSSSSPAVNNRAAIDGFGNGAIKSAFLATLETSSSSTTSITTATHAIWQGGRKIKDTNIPFVPSTADLPDYDGKVFEN